MGKRAGLGRPTYTSLWFRLLKQQKERGSTGFTLSFLIGAAISGIKLDEDAAYGELAGLLSSFANETPVGFHVVIGNCTKLRQYSYREGAYRAFSAEDLRTIASAQKRT